MGERDMTGTLISPGLHHVTAITGNLYRNLHFYTQVLGLRLVKQTVNFDDLRSYHLYYGDEVGAPGTVVTFFVWPNAGPGRRGAGFVQRIGFAIPPAAQGYWIGRLIEKGIGYERREHFGLPVLTLQDPDGIWLDLVATETQIAWTPPSASPVPADVAIRGLHNVALWSERGTQTGELLTTLLGFGGGDALAQERVYHMPTGQVMYVRDVGGFWPGDLGSGAIHHVAFRVENDSVLIRGRGWLVDQGRNPTQVRDRKYFRSVYAQEPGMVILELATDGPGFGVDEATDELGGTLQLPNDLFESQRAQIRANFPSVEIQ